MLGEPQGDRRAGDAVAVSGTDLLGSLVERIAEVVLRDGVEHDAERVGFVAQLDRRRREDALARSAAPQLDDLDLLAACPLPCDRGATAIRAALGSLLRVWNACCP